MTEPTGPEPRMESIPAVTMIAISSTPRKGGNSDILVDRIASAAVQRGAAVQKVSLAGLSIRGCTACDKCQGSLDDPCVINDDAPPILRKLIEADSIVFGAPVYFFAVAAQLKTLLDRSYSLGGAGRWDALAGRRVGIVLTYGDDDRSASGVENAIGMFRDMAGFLDLTIEGIIEAQCGAAGEVKANQPALDAAWALGERLAGHP